MRSGSDDHLETPRARRGAAAPSVRLAQLVAIGLGPWLAACATAPPRSTRVPHAPGARLESKTLGPRPRAGCFHVSREPGSDRYRFVLEDMQYPRALGAGRVGVIVHAVGFDDLQPRPIELPRLRRLDFRAEGQASGAFELILFLIGGNDDNSEPTWLGTIC